jgi:hypothetical protein
VTLDRTRLRVSTLACTSRAFQTLTCGTSHGGRFNRSSSYALDLDVPEAMEKLHFSILAERRVTGESICRNYTGDFDLTDVKAVNLTVTQTLPICPCCSRTALGARFARLFAACWRGPRTQTRSSRRFTARSPTPLGRDYSPSC